MINITSNVKQAVETLKRIPKHFEGAAVPALQDAARLIRRIMARPGLAVRYPINWDSQKQKRYVMAKLRREGNLPYQRTGEHASGWESIDLFDGAVVQNLGHKAVFLYGTPSGEFPGAVHVQSSGQSHIHKDRWRLVRPVIDAVVARLPAEIVNKFRIDVNG